MHYFLRVLIAASALLLACSSLAAVANDGLVPVPPLTGRVVDLTGTLDATQRAALEAQLAAFEQKKGAQVAVLLVPTIQPESIEQFGIRLAETWKIGRKGIDDGVILIIAKEDRQLRIEVGYGLEGALNDATAKRIVSEIITPPLREGNFHAGVAAGVDAIISVIDGEPLPPAATQANGQGGDAAGMLPLLMVAAVLARFFHMLLGLAGSLLVAAVGGLLAFWLLGSVLSGLVVAVILLVISLGRGGGGYGGGRGGFGGGGGGFSGGGGGFGGGGASGRW